MSRTLAFLAVLLAGVLILLSLAATSAHTGSAWRALPSGEFRAVPGSAGTIPATAGRSPEGFGGSLLPIPGSIAPSTPPSGPIFSPTAKPVSTSRPCCASSTVTAKGWATYQPGTGLWGSPSQLVYDWTGSHVRVCGPLACRSIETRGWCACGPRHGERTLIDLSEEAFAVLCCDLSAGVCRVEVTRG